MSQYNNQGYLFFKNGKFSGKITVDGIERRIEGWWKESKGGRKNELISLTVRSEEEYQATKHKIPKPKDYEYHEPESFPEQNIQGGAPEMNDIPF